LHARRLFHAGFQGAGRRARAGGQKGGRAMTVDREYCMSSFLTYRIIADMERCFAPGVEPRRFPFPEKRLPVRDSQTLLAELERATREACKDGKAALALSGGIDSA